MSQVAELVRLFYGELWNQKNLAIADQILHQQVSFRGSLGQQMVGREQVCDYVIRVTTSLDQYTCQIQELVAEGDRAAAKVLFRGIHVQDFMGFEPTGKAVQWLGTAFFTSTAGALTDIWVLGDMQGLLSNLEANNDKSSNSD